MSKEDLERLDDRGMSAWNDHDAEAWVGLFADEFAWHDWSVPEPVRDEEARGSSSTHGSPRSRTCG